MKKVLTFLFICASLIGYSQNSNIDIKFKANEEADIWIGKAWDYSYSQLKNPINVDFNGKLLKMYYDNGKVFWETDIISYERKEKKNYDKLEEEVYILKIEDKGFIQYLVIEKYYSYGYVTTQIKIPYVSDTGEIMSYHYYQQF